MDIVLAVLLFVGFFCAGRRISAALGLPFSCAVECGLLSTALGLVVLTYAFMLLAFCGWAYSVSAWLLLAATAGVGVLAHGHRRQSFAPGGKLAVPLVPAEPGTQRLFVFVAVCLGLVLFLSLTLSLLPPTRTDTLVYHFAIPKAYLQHHGIVNLPNNIFSFFPLFFEMLYLLCLALKGEVLATLAGWGAALLLIATMTLFYRRRFPDGRMALLVPTLFLATPTFFELTATGYVDLAAAAFVFFTFYAWDRWRETDHNGWLVLTALFAGAAVGAKLPTAPAFILAWFGVAVIARETRKSSAWMLRATALFFASGLAFLLPWWIKNFFYSGNPFVPLLMNTFDSLGAINWDANRTDMTQQYAHASGMGRGIIDLLLLPVNLAFFARKNHLRFDGEIGPIYCLLLPGLFFLWRRTVNGTRSTVRVLGVLCAVLMAWWFAQFQLARFLSVPFTFFVLLCVYGWELWAGTVVDARLETPARKFFGHCAVALVIGGLLCNLFLIAVDWREARPWDFLLGRETRAQYLTRRIPLFPMYQELNRALGERDKALFVYMRNFGYLAEKPFHSDSIFEAHTLQTLLQRAPTAEGLLDELRRLGFTHLMFDSAYVFAAESAFSPEQQAVLRSLLQTRATLLAAKNGVYLYRFMLN
jgi:hypothetical protein